MVAANTLYGRLVQGLSRHEGVSPALLQPAVTFLKSIHETPVQEGRQKRKKGAAGKRAQVDDGGRKGETGGKQASQRADLEHTTTCNPSHRFQFAVSKARVAHVCKGSNSTNADTSAMASRVHEGIGATLGVNNAAAIAEDPHRVLVELPWSTCMVEAMREGMAPWHAYDVVDSRLSSALRNGPHARPGDAINRPALPRVIVEFSSPNIGKPFHVGHLRSTIIGNVLAHGYELSGFPVSRRCYFGDWGRQVALVAYGYARYGSEEQLAHNGLRHLLDVYVRANQDLKEEQQGLQQEGGGHAAPSYPEKGTMPVSDRVNEFIARLEGGESEAVELWHLFRNASIASYTQEYRRLNVFFDEYDFESNYAQHTDEIVDSVVAATRDDRNAGDVACGLKQEKNGALIVEFRSTQDGKGEGEGEGEGVFPACVLKKANGQSTYLSRDLAAVLSRLGKANEKDREGPFVAGKSSSGSQRYLYVVADEQSLHFKQLFSVLGTIAPGVRSQCEFVSFGLVNGLSSRGGNVVFLRDVLETATATMMKNMGEAQASSTAVEKDETDCDNLDVSCADRNLPRSEWRGTCSQENEESQHEDEPQEGKDGIPLKREGTGSTYRRFDIHSPRSVLNSLEGEEHRSGKVATKGESEAERMEATARVLALSSVVVQDLKAKRSKNYTFDWARMLSSTGDTGVFLQYTHARLCSIIDKSSLSPYQIAAFMDGVDGGNGLAQSPSDVEHLVSGLVEDEHARQIAHLLLQKHLIRDGVLSLHEPSILVQYLFRVSRAVSSSLGTFRVKGERDANVARQRLTMLVAARDTLADGLAMLGLPALRRV